MVSEKLIDGKELSKTIRAELKDRVSQFTRQGKRPPGLCTILVGEDPASQVYVRNKRKQAERVGINSIHHKFENSVSQKELIALIHKLNEDSNIDGILVQLPLPKHINEDLIIKSILPLKDVDGFHPENVGLLSIGHPRFVSCTPKGCLALLKAANASLEGANAVVVGRSNIVGKPIASLLLAENATVTICHSRTKNLAEVSKRADIVIAAIGKPRFLNSKHIKEGAFVIDVGINRLDNGRLVGDVDTSAVLEKVARITPVPGGVGPMTIAMLLQNTVEAYVRSENL